MYCFYTRGYITPMREKKVDIMALNVELDMSIDDYVNAFRQAYISFVYI